MIKAPKDKYLSYAVAAIAICSYLCAIAFHDIPSYEQDFLEGVTWLLHWCMVLYLPLFPFVAGIFIITISKTITAIAITTTNFFLTLLFTIFACSSGILSTSWIMLSIASLVVMLTAHYDKYQSTKMNNNNSPMTVFSQLSTEKRIAEKDERIEELKGRIEELKKK